MSLTYLYASCIYISFCKEPSQAQEVMIQIFHYPQTRMFHHDHLQLHPVSNNVKFFKRQFICIYSSKLRSQADSPAYNANGRHLTAVDASRANVRQDTISSTEEDNFSEFTRSKRKYRRHAKADKNAPVKPPSAYVMFSNQVRSELKDYNMSFTDLAKIVGDRWKSITPDEKEVYERTATKAKEEYLDALAKYEKTDEHKVVCTTLWKTFSHTNVCLSPHSK